MTPTPSMFSAYFTTSHDKEPIVETLISIAFIAVVCFYMFRTGKSLGSRKGFGAGRRFRRFR